MRVSSNGAGVPYEDRKKVFQVFYRGGNELQRRTKGTGLGLFIVSTLVKQLKGRISVDDREDGQPGCTFSVDLPGVVLPTGEVMPAPARLKQLGQTLNQHSDSRSSSPLRSNTSATCRMSQKKHILIVEDEESIAEGLRFNFVHEGYGATVVGDGRSAIQHFDEGGDGADLIVLDLMLPGMSGYEICREIREKDSRVPILVLSADAQRRPVACLRLRS